MPDAGSFTSSHTLHFASSQEMHHLQNDSAALVVTSPPYPMIEMWDESLAADDPRIADALQQGDGRRAFDLMHAQLDSVWVECLRVLRPGGIMCINVGDATRSVGGSFALYTNHSRITAACERLGFSSLPPVLWRKPTNAPNKFMGSGMLPAGAYVTYEHEYILIFRKGYKRSFTTAEAGIRRRSAFFWEERNQWFSDIWDLKGARQLMSGDQARSRSAAFPLELAYRLVHMYSMQTDVVLDPFAGTGTTTLAAMLGGRSSVGYERLAALGPVIARTLEQATLLDAQIRETRLSSHASFVADRIASGKVLKHHNVHYDMPVMTGQERELVLPVLESVAGVGMDAPDDPLEVTATHLV